MMKVEAVVIRDRVETVIDAVEEETGHVGVTVVEAVGHGRQRGITHEYRGSRVRVALPAEGHLTFLVRDEIADAGAGGDRRRGAQRDTSRATGICWSRPSRTSPTTAPG